MILSLRLRMMVAVGLLAVAAIVAVALAARQRTRSEFRRFQQLEKISVSSHAGGDPERISSILAGRCCDSNALRTAANALSPQQALVITDGSGNVIAKSGKPLEGVSEFRFSRDGEVVAIEATGRDHGAAVTGVSLRFRVRGTPVSMANGDTTYLYVFPFPEDQAERPEAVFLGSVDRSLLLATTLIAAIALLATWTLTRRIVGPIEELRVATRDLARGRLGRRVDTSGSDEIAELGRSFNAMAAELENQQALRRNLVHDVVHELRTPLTALRCRVDSVTDGVSTDPRKEIAGANEEIDHLARLVEDLHELALAEARELKFNISEMPLGPIVESAARAASLDGDPRLRVNLDEALVVRGDAMRLRQVVLNILSNAARYTPAEGTITVNACRRDGETVVEVQNTGSKLTSDEVAHVFDRFYRADPSRQRATGGTGLGLTIVKNLVEAQGGRVWARSDESGVTFAFALPA
jgi:signal transduction histidine kinase